LKVLRTDRAEFGPGLMGKGIFLPGVTTEEGIFIVRSRGQICLPEKELVGAGLRSLSLYPLLSPESLFLHFKKDNFCSREFPEL
jgi:hypothetical protein